MPRRFRTRKKNLIDPYHHSSVMVHIYIDDECAISPADDGLDEQPATTQSDVCTEKTVQCVHERVRAKTLIIINQNRLDQSKLRSLFCQQEWRF